jgi:hypothetical protein
LGSRTSSSHSHGNLGDVAGLAAAVPVVHLGQQPQRLGALDQPHTAAALAWRVEGSPPRVQLVLDVVAGGAVAEAAVDARLGGIQQADRLAAGLGVLEVPPHERAEDAAAAVGRQHRDEPQPGRRHPGESRQGQLQRERAGGGDDLVAVEGGQGTVVLDVRGQVGVLAVVVAQAVGDGHGAAEPLPPRRVDRSDLEVHAPVLRPRPSRRSHIPGLLLIRGPGHARPHSCGHSPDNP